jgi:hypothetical protein
MAAEAFSPLKNLAEKGRNDGLEHPKRVGLRVRSPVRRKRPEEEPMATVRISLSAEAVQHHQFSSLFCTRACLSLSLPLCIVNDSLSSRLRRISVNLMTVSSRRDSSDSQNLPSP